MKLSKNIPYKWIDKFKKEREGIIEIRIKNSSINLSNVTLNTLINVLCIFMKCNYDCKVCCLKNEDIFKEYMKER